MLVARFVYQGRPGVGIVDSGEVRPLTGLSAISDRVVLRIAMSTPESVERSYGSPLSLRDVRLLAPILRPRKVICVGANYPLHAKEGGVDLPSHPNIFAKFPTAVIGPGEAIVIPHEDPTVDYEGELCVVIGRGGRRIPVGRALEHVAGYCAANDVSARTTQTRVSQWVIGKSPDTFCPIGPWLADRSSVPDPGKLRLQTILNDETLQDSMTSDMHFDVPTLIAYASQLITLEPGDLILTGTPEGVGAARVPPVYLKDGDRIEVFIHGIGTLSNPVSSELPAATRGH